MQNIQIQKGAILLWLALIPAVTIAQVPALTVSGADAALERNIHAHVNLSSLTCAMSVPRLNRALPQIRDGVTRAGRALGYYLLEQEATFLRGESCGELNIIVNPGEPVRVSNINVVIDNDSKLFRSFFEDAPLKEGDPLNQARYESLKSQLSSLAIENGFFDARFNRSELLLDLEKNLATVEIDFAPGDRYRFSAVNIEPVPDLSDEFIKKYINFEPGELYSSEKLIELRNSLNDSLYFSNVAVTPDLDNTQGLDVPLQVNLALRPRRAYTSGVGMTTDIGPRLRFDFDDRYVNRRGHKFNVRSITSPVQQFIDVNYTIPMWDPTTQALRFSAGLLRENTDTFDTQSVKLGAAYSFVNRFDWQQSLFLNFLHEEFSINDQDEVADLLMPGINMHRTQADDALYPQRGWYLFGQLTGASTSLISTQTFLQMRLTGKWLRRIGPGRVIVKFDAGTTAVNNIGELPITLQFFAGGDQSVRGYQYQSLGPLNSMGEVIGGKHLLAAGIEYDFSILPDWKLAVFLDAGNAFNDFNNYELNKGAGIGIRWLSPIGPIRVDLASALDNDNKLRLHITMGPDL